MSQVCGRRGQEIESCNSKILHAKQLQDDFDHVMSQVFKLVIAKDISIMYILCVVTFPVL